MRKRVNTLTPIPSIDEILYLIRRTNPGLDPLQPVLKAEKEIDHAVILFLYWSWENLISANKDYLEQVLIDDDFSYDNVIKYLRTVQSETARDYFLQAYQWNFRKRKFGSKDERDDFLNYEIKLISNILTTEKDVHSEHVFIRLIILYTFKSLFSSTTSADIDEIKQQILAASDIWKKLKDSGDALEQLQVTPGIEAREVADILDILVRDRSAFAEIFETYDPDKVFDNLRKDLYSSPEGEFNLDKARINKIVEAIYYEFVDFMNESEGIYLSFVNSIQRYRVFLQAEKRKPFAKRGSADISPIFSGIDVVAFINYLIDEKECFDKNDRMTLYNLFEDPKTVLRKNIAYKKSAASLARILVDLFEQGKVGPDKKTVALWLFRNFKIRGRQRTQSYWYKLLEPTTQSKALSTVPESAFRLTDRVDIHRFLI